MMRVFILLYSIWGTSESIHFLVTAERGLVLTSFNNIPFENYITTGERKKKLITEITIINNISSETIELHSFKLTPFIHRYDGFLCYYFTYEMSTDEVLNYLMLLQISKKINNQQIVVKEFKSFLIKNDENGNLYTKHNDEISETYEIYKKYTYKFIYLIRLIHKKTKKRDFIDEIIQELQKLEDNTIKEVALTIFNFINLYSDKEWNNDLYNNIKIWIITVCFKYCNPELEITEMNPIQNPFFYLNNMGFKNFCRNFYFHVEQICLINGLIDYNCIKKEEEKCKNDVDLPKIYFYRHIILTSGCLKEYELEDIELIFVRNRKFINFKHNFTKKDCRILLYCENLKDTKDLYVYVCIKKIFISNPIEIESVL